MSHSGRGVQVTLEGKEALEDWNFAKANTSYLTHGLHDYPARMIPQIAQRLIERYTPEKGRVLDPFCGSGTTLVEARLADRDSVGIDINPLAVLLSKVKSCPIDFGQSDFDVARFLSTVEEKHADARRHDRLPEPPKEILPNLLHWFKEPVTRDLEFLFEMITEFKNVDIRDFFNIILSDTVFRTSNIDLRASRFIRILHKKELADFSPNVLKHFRKKTLDSVARMTQYVRRLTEVAVDENRHVAVRKADARSLPFGKDEFDAAVTSPPYGEEKNTVGYARWSKLSVAWLRLNDDGLKESEKRSLGATSDKNTLMRLNEIQSPTAIKLLEPISKADPERIRDALPFFFDYLKTLKEVYRVLKPDAFYCLVSGDRSIRKKLLDMEKVTIELGAAVGFKHVESFFRNIPIKLIPWNTPTGKTISRESIIVLQKK